MLVELTEVVPSGAYYNDQSAYTLCSRHINPEWVTDIKEDTKTSQLLKEGKLPPGLNEEVKFTRIFLNRGNGSCEIIVVGERTDIARKLNGTPKKKMIYG